MGVMEQWSETPTGGSTWTAVTPLLSNVSIAVGHTKAQTRLPLPAFKEGDNDKTRMALLESAVVTWTRQINSILKRQLTVANSN